ncbi:MAG: PSD1 domain-containing protein, partial [Planctomycetales bacterium]|nr:PSD1 domain-containing protein [Planctomycetales bacterium]
MGLATLAADHVSYGGGRKEMVGSTRSVVCSMLLAFSSSVALFAAEPSAQDIEFFEKQVRPILVTHCHSCHGEKKQKANLRLDSLAGALKGGDTGPAVEPGKIDDSLLIDAINYGETFKMPPKGKLPAETIAMLTEWVRRGAPWPASDAVGPAAKNPEPFDLRARAARHWSFQPIRPTDPPPTADKSWPRSAVDRFLLAKLEAAGLKPAATADKRALLRRVTFDLIGLPPTPDEIAQFIADESPQAFERVVDRLLASPHFGERWGRHWLDLVRFAETRGHEFDFEIPHAFEYRDYVIRALNADVPYNQFVTEHVAGDLLPKPRRHPDDKINESVIGTGFWFLGEGKHSPVDIAGDAADRVDNQIDVFGKTFLGLTLGCARCHDHKFDAISTRDYYSLAGFLQSSRYHVACVDSDEERSVAVLQLAEIERQRELVLRSAASELAMPTLAKLDQILLAAATAVRSGGKIESLAERLSAGDVEPWVKHLREVSAKRRDDPFHVWALWSQRSGDRSPAEFVKFRDEFVKAAEQNAAQRGAMDVFADFSREEHGWFNSGDAFPGRGLVQADGGHRVNGAYLSRGLHGTLRSPTFTIRSKGLWFRMAGAGAKLNLIVDGFQLIRNPIYGGLTISPNTAENGSQPQWFRMEVSKWVGHNAYIELLDDGPGTVAIEAVVFSDGGLPPDPYHPQSLALLARPDVTSAESFAQALRSAAVANVQHGEKAIAAEKAAGQSFEPTSLSRWMIDASLPGTVQHALASRSDAAAVKRLAELDGLRKQAESRIAYRRHAMSLVDGNAVDEHVFIRGNPKTPGDVVPRRFLEAFEGADQPVPTSGSGRLGLAKKLTDPAVTPIVPRVIVNRVWQHVFGEGIARTPDDFGNMGQPPTHPELLDFLTDEFVRDGWSIKRLIRRLVLANAY